jgi:hypothetical protein
MKILRPLLVFLVFATVGLLAYYLTALISGEPWGPAWEKDGLMGVVLWAYERGSIVTVVVLFVLAFGCAWLPFNPLLAAISLGLFYPINAIVRVVIGSHSGNLLPFEFLGYLLFIVMCLVGYVAGRWVRKRFRPAAA